VVGGIALGALGANGMQVIQPGEAGNPVQSIDPNADNRSAWTRWMDSLSQKIEETKPKVKGLWDHTSQWLGRLPGDATTWFGGMVGGAGTALAVGNERVNADTGRMWGITSGNLSGLPADGTTWFGGLGANAGAALGAAQTDTDGRSKNIFERIGENLVGLPGKAVDLFGGFRRGADQEGQGAAGDTDTWLGRITRSIGGTSLWQSGVELIKSFGDGLSRQWENLMAWAGRAMANLRSYWPFSPAERGAFSGRGYVTYSGAALTGDFADSIRAGTPGIIAAARAATTQAQLQLGPIQGRGSQPLTLGTSTGGGGSPVINNHFHIAGTVVAERELLDLIQDRTLVRASRNTSNGLG
jgi:hypothetical protein